ncbi:hypothetical protein [Hanstruepera ponticola]|uniref:hypothetical protein n=1 Tax=Hanstruepera ponticola TaxID=2042995 RepID=UPI00177CB566|nr:hypothetical protein [Hanstruepera ponticola]
MNRFFRKFRLVSIDVFIYHMVKYNEFQLPKFKYTIQRENIHNKTRFFIKDLNTLVHESYVFKKVFLLKSIHKNGPVIGDCFTNKQYRGQAIYPVVINYIAKHLLENNSKEVFVVVNKSNKSSIKGIEKAGFDKLASIKAKRWLWFYSKREINYFNRK